MVNPNSGFQIPRVNVYDAVADPESFSCIVHLTRFGKLPEVQNVPMLLEQADYWGVKEAIEKELSDSCIREKERVKERVANAISRSGWSVEYAVFKATMRKHHNYRSNDGAGRIYCRCGNRDFDDRWYDEPKTLTSMSSTLYTSCKNCKNDIFFNPGYLGWCHMCGLCDNCQRRNGIPCPNNFQMHMGRSRYSPIKSEINNETLSEEFSRLVIDIF